MAAVTPRVTIRPPPSLPSFNGSIEDWPQFWDLFSGSVGDVEIPAAEKAVALVALLQDEAKEAVAGIPVTASHYDTIVGIQKERFDRPDIRRKRLLQDFMSTAPIPNPTKSLSATRKAVDRLSAVTRRLELSGVDIGAFGVLLEPIFVQKLPQRWREKWVRDMSGQSTDMEQFLSFIKREMNVAEATSIDPVTPSSSATTNQEVSKPKHFTALLMAPGAANKPEHKRPPRHCSICDKTMHKIVHCRKYLDMTPADRRTEIARLGRCARCLRRAPHSVESPCPEPVCNRCQKNV